MCLLKRVSMSSKLELRIVSGEHACDVLPTAHALQSTGLKNRCESVLYDYLTTRFADGKESETCKNVFYFLHLAEKCHLMKVLDFCTPLASEYSSGERREALKSYPVSTDLRLKLGDMAEERLEIIAEDNSKLFQEFISSAFEIETYKEERLLRNRISVIIDMHKVSRTAINNVGRNNESLRALRLAFDRKPKDKDLISTHVQKVRTEMKDQNWNKCFGREFALLPLKVKTYIKGRKVNEF